MWKTEAIVRDLLINLVAGILIFIVGLRWGLISSFLSRERAAFRRIFGARAVEAGIVTVTLDTYRDLRLLPSAVQQQLSIQAAQLTGPQGQRFFKIFPDGHWTMFPGAFGDILGYCSARAAAYLINKLASVRKITVRVISDTDIEVASKWDGTFINLGSSASNIKTDSIKHLPENTWFLDDLGKFTFKDGRDLEIDASGDKGIILKLVNPHFPGHSLFVCAGLGEWGTSGSAWFLSTHWRMLSRRFGKHPFLIALSVTPGNDESTREILSFGAFGEETMFWRVRSWLRAKK